MLISRELLVLRRTPEGRKILGKHLALHRIEKYGIPWLYANAPLGWPENLYAIRSGVRIMFRARDVCDNECVLALAFQFNRKLANSSGYVTYASVANHFKLTEQECNRLGFTAFTGLRPRDPVTSTDLDLAWCEAMKKYLERPRPPYQHRPSNVVRLPRVIGATLSEIV